ncbi:hypothetical protein Pelo_8858 [Pelomyxa schiedti]|nr:hypothetical protein Pelo_8858 [Pelomyxa schiedti]
MAFGEILDLFSSLSSCVNRGIVDAITFGYRDIAELLLCHGASFPESALNDGTTLELHGEFVDAHHPSVWRFFNTTPTWDPQKHKLFPWWFKVLILKTVLLCWFRSANTCTESAKSTATQPGHCSIGRLSRFNVHFILSFFSPVHWKIVVIFVDSDFSDFFQPIKPPTVIVDEFCGGGYDKATLVGDLGADSLCLVEICRELEAYYHITIPAAEGSRATTVANVVTLVKSKLSK